MFLPQKPLTALRQGVLATLDTTRPWLVQMVVTRRCNLSCGYCNEYDDFSPPVPTETLLRQVDHLAELGTVVLTFTGGEPLLHPELDRVVRYAVDKGMVVTTISNAYPITVRWIERLNAAGLTLLQVSVDNLEPNEVSQKSWMKVRKRLEILRDHAKFGVNINAVLGSSPPSETRTLAADVRSLGFFMTVGLLHDGHGQLDRALAGDELSQLYTDMRNVSKKSVFHGPGEGWEEEMIETGTSAWKCRAGARYLYVDEFGKVSYCSQRRGDPGTPLLEYTREHARRAFETQKGCAPSCTIGCVRRASAMDDWRSQSRPDVGAKQESRKVHLPVA